MHEDTPGSASSPVPEPPGLLRGLRTDMVVSLVLLVLGAWFMVEACRVGLGDFGNPGPGVFPLLVAALLVATSAASLVEELRATSEPEPEEDFGGDVAWGKILGALAITALVPVLAGTTGFITTLSVAIALMARLLGAAGWLRSALLGAGFGVAVWLIFVQWLLVPLPVGSLGLM